MKWLGWLFTLSGGLMILIGLIPAVLIYPGKSPELTFTNPEYLYSVVFEFPEHWIWQIGIVVMIIGLWLIRKIAKRGIEGNRG